MDGALWAIIKTMVTAYACRADNVSDFFLFFFRSKTEPAAFRINGAAIAAELAIMNFRLLKS